MKILLLLFTLNFISCSQDVTYDDYNEEMTIVHSKTEYTNYINTECVYYPNKRDIRTICKEKVGKHEYCRSSGYRNTISVDCKVFDEMIIIYKESANSQYKYINEKHPME